MNIHHSLLKQLFLRLYQENGRKHIKKFISGVRYDANVDTNKDINIEYQYYLFLIRAKGIISIILLLFRNQLAGCFIKLAQRKNQFEI